MATILYCLRTSGVAGLSNFAVSATLAFIAISFGAVGTVILPANLVGLPESPLVILACLLLLSGFRQFFGMPALRMRTLVAVVVLFSCVHFTFALMEGGVTSIIGTGTAALIFAAIAWTIHRGGRQADEPRAFILFAILSTAAGSAFFMARFATIAINVDGLSYFADPTAWNLAVASIRILLFPITYLSAILLVQARTVARLERALAYDDLTGALSRRAFIEACSRHFDPDRDKAKGGTLLFLDLDHFKQLNDRHGHDIGDKALKHFVEVASKVLPPQASLGRLGGEEFAILLPTDTKTAAVSTAERLIEAVRDTPLNTGRLVVPMTVSIGIAAAHPGVPLNEILKHADEALYRAKVDGRSRFCFADETMPIADGESEKPGSGDRRELRSRRKASATLPTSVSS